MYKDGTRYAVNKLIIYWKTNDILAVKFDPKKLLEKLTIKNPTTDYLRSDKDSWKIEMITDNTNERFTENLGNIDSAGVIFFHTSTVFAYL